MALDMTKLFEKLLNLEHRMSQGFSGVSWRQDKASEDRERAATELKELRDRIVKLETAAQDLKEDHKDLSKNVRDVELTGAHKLADIQADAAMIRGENKANDKRETRDMEKWKVNAGIIIAVLTFLAVVVEKLMDWTSQ